jgi:hypothetical protein
MKEIATRGRIDRSYWARGPWDRELADMVKWKDNATGSPCIAIRATLGFWCGYVGVPMGHPAYGVNWRRQSGLKAHARVDYSNPCSGTICHEPEPGEPDQVWWLGFAAAYGNDLKPGWDTHKGSLFGPARPYDPRGPLQYRTLAYVREQCANLAAQLAQIAQGRHVPERLGVEKA